MNLNSSKFNIILYVKNKIMFILEQFDKNKPYYYYVYQYLVNFYGSNVIYNKYLFSKLSSVEESLRLFGQWEYHIDGFDLKDDEKEYLNQGTPVYPRLLFPYNLANSFNSETILINDENIIQQIDSLDSDVRLISLSKMSNMLIVMGFESLPSHIRYDKYDQFSNFFYHCRNAAAHGGKFNITNKNRFPAEWRGIRLDLTHNNSNLVLDSKGNGFLKPMDIVLILLDAEKKYFQHLNN